MRIRLTKRSAALKLEIPVFVDQEKPVAKPGLPSNIPAVVRWTRYGRWTDDGLTVESAPGRAIYEDPLAVIERARLAWAFAE